MEIIGWGEFIPDLDSVAAEASMKNSEKRCNESLEELHLRKLTCLSFCYEGYKVYFSNENDPDFFVDLSNYNISRSGRIGRSYYISKEFDQVHPHGFSQQVIFFNLSNYLDRKSVTRKLY